MIEKVARAIWDQRRIYAARQGVDLEEWGDGKIAIANGVMDEAKVAIAAMAPFALIALAEAFAEAGE